MEAGTFWGYILGYSTLQGIGVPPRCLPKPGFPKPSRASEHFKLFDERGLFLLVVPTGGKLWRFKYRFDGREQSLGLGHYPDVLLKQGRDARDALSEAS